MNGRAIMPPARRLGVLLAAMLLQACLGGLYAWSLGVLPFAQEMGLEYAHVNMMFAVIIAGFGLATGVVWPLVIKLGATRSCVVAAALMAIGPLIGQNGSLELFAVGGLVTGAGLGFGYLAPRDMLRLWFPGQANQILVSQCLSVAFGLAVFVVAPCFQHLLEDGYRSFLLWTDILNVLVICAAAWWLREPTDWQAAAAHSTAPADDVALIQLSPLARLLDTLTFTMGSTGGLALIGTAAPLFTLWGNMGLADTALLVGLMGLMNAGGRAVWFIASRWWSMRIATAVMLIIETIGLWELSTSMMAAQLLIHVAACAVAFGYGGVVAFGPALLARHGLATFADNHGVHGVPALCWGLVGAAAVVATVQFGHGQVFPLLAGLCLTMAMVQACMQIDAH